MKLQNNQAGFSAFELILVVLVLGALAVISLRVLTDHNSSVNNSTAAAPQTAKSASDVSEAPVVNKASDLNKAEAALDQNDPAAANQADSNQLNGQLAGLN